MTHIFSVYIFNAQNGVKIGGEKVTYFNALPGLTSLLIKNSQGKEWRGGLVLRGTVFRFTSLQVRLTGIESEFEEFLSGDLTDHNQRYSYEFYCSNW